MAPGDVARAYHRLTSNHSRTDWPGPATDPRLVNGFETDVLATFPAPCKSYPAGLPVVELPRRWPRERAAATVVLAGRAMARQAAAAAATPDLTQLARLLHLSAGVVRTAERSDGRRYLFRAAGSAGGRFPLELYLAAHDVPGLAGGVYWFDPLRHTLVAIGPSPDGQTTTLVVTGIPWRTGWRYAERGWRHLYWDAGAMLANTIAVAEDAGLAPRLRTEFPDAEVTRLVGADGVGEFPLAILTLGDGEPAIHPTGVTGRGAVDRRPPLEFPLVTEAQHAGDGETLGAPWPLGADSAASPLASAGAFAPPASAGLDEVILRRISTRVMDASAAIARPVVEWSLEVCLRGCAIPHFLAAHAVDGLEPAMYRWPVLARATRRGDLRRELFRACAEQELARDASLVVIAAVDLATLDDRGYRDAQLAAGLVDGRLHLAAFALGLGASGMTFLDPEIPALLGLPLAGLLFTCLGRPAYRHRSGGLPGAPVKMRPLARAPS
jgi:SagB-type dehydrogenase family enzyme